MLLFVWLTVTSSTIANEIDHLELVLGRLNKKQSVQLSFKYVSAVSGKEPEVVLCVCVCV